VSGWVLEVDERRKQKRHHSLSCKLVIFRKKPNNRMDGSLRGPNLAKKFGLPDKGGRCHGSASDKMEEEKKKKKKKKKGKK